ncbi:MULTISPECIES: DUF1542 domain-containing protein [Vibrio harveyi group]|uniref:DUF1542 domain-containing protein n=1 Tax=Vibrio harveyi group TaxID=717610 RepID=UPI00215DEF45|nr:DUF1542 domain-containing protein [Vibrio alginolyticus]MCS0297510.1 DUF1542 domain-containing protein [Vibrio alginolyticus]
MSIKQSIAALVILLSVSFSASAYYDYDLDKFYKVEKLKGTFSYPAEYCGLSVGQVFTLRACLGVSFKSTVDGKSYTVDEVAYNNGPVYGFGGNKNFIPVYVTPVSSCPSGQLLNPDTGRCEEPNPPYCSRQSTLDAINSARTQCESQGRQFSYSCSNETESWESECNGGDCSDVEGEHDSVAWDSSIWGNSSPASYLCSSKGGGCGASIDGSSSWCGESGWCYASYTVIGPACDVPNGPSFCSDPLCTNFKDPDSDEKPDTDPTHDPDDPTGGDIEDPSVLPDSDNDVVVPDPPTDEPDVEDPPTDESTDTAVVSAITGMNKDVNKALNEMNIDINQASADVQNQIIALNASVVTNTQAIQKQQANDNEIYRKTKSLIQQANADITTAVNKNTNAINGVGNDVEQIAGAMDGIAEDVAGISETLDGIANTDTSGAGTGGTCIEAGNCTGFYESAYPDGLGGLVSGQLNDLKTNVIDDFVNSFGNIDLSNAQRPSFVLPVPFYGDFSFEEHISFDWIFGFVRAVLIMSSIFAARRIIFGG